MSQAPHLRSRSDTAGISGRTLRAAGASQEGEPMIGIVIDEKVPKKRQSRSGDYWGKCSGKSTGVEAKVRGGRFNSQRIGQDIRMA